MYDLQNKTIKINGITFTQLLQLLLIALKLMGYINWKWWQVLLPFEIGVGVFVIGLILFIIQLIKNKIKKTRIEKQLQKKMELRKYLDNYIKKNYGLFNMKYKKDKISFILNIYSNYWFENDCEISAVYDTKRNIVTVNNEPLSEWLKNNA